MKMTMGKRLFNRILLPLSGSLLLILLLSGCVRQDAWLSYTAVHETPQPTATPAQTLSPTVEPIAIEAEPVLGEDFHTDRKGIPILDKDTHYFTYYLASICFYDKDEKLVGYGVIHTAEGGLTLGVGANRIYAEILSEVDVQQLTCRIEQITPFNPA